LQGHHYGNLTIGVWCTNSKMAA